MIFTKEDITVFKWDDKNKIVFIYDDMGIDYSDKVVIPMKSGTKAVYKIVRVTPVINYSTLSKAQTKIKGEKVWRVKLEAEGYQK